MLATGRRRHTAASARPRSQAVPPARPVSLGSRKGLHHRADHKYKELLGARCCVRAASVRRGMRALDIW